MKHLTDDRPSSKADRTIHLLRAVTGKIPTEHHLFHFLRHAGQREMISAFFHVRQNPGAEPTGFFTTRHRTGLLPGATALCLVRRP